MIDEKYAKDQVRRLQAMKFFPSDPVAAKELITALLSADDEKRAKAAVDNFLATTQECPTPADIRRAVIREDAPEYSLPFEQPSDVCPACNGIGAITENGKYVRCLCSNGVTIDEKLIEMMNSPKGPTHRHSSVESRIRVDKTLEVWQYPD